MDSASIYYKNMADAMTYDGNMLFGHDRRNYIPLRIDLSARGEWLPKEPNHMDSRDKRYYAHEVHVPDDYMIVEAETFTPTTIHEEARFIRINKQQVAIPMTWFFRLKDMTIYEQWDFLRVYRLDIPSKLKAKTYLDDALNKAYDLGMEVDFLNMFYDMERDDPKEFKRRKNLLAEKKKEVRTEMKSCLAEINKLRATADSCWSELSDELYSEYSSGKMFGVMSFMDYCELAARMDEKYREVQETVCKVHSVAWYISMITDDYITIDEKLKELATENEFNGSLYSFGM